MKLNKSTILISTLLSFLVLGQSATADERAPRDEYSMEVVWDINSQNVKDSRVNFSMQESDTRFESYGENAPRDEYSIGLVWDTGATDSRVNYSIEPSKNFNSDELFPDYER